MFQGETTQYFSFVFHLQQITRPSQEDKSDDKNEEDKSEKSEKKEDEEKKDEEEKDEKEDSRWIMNSCLSSIISEKGFFFSMYVTSYFMLVFES